MDSKAVVLERLKQIPRFARDDSREQHGEPREEAAKLTDTRNRSKDRLVQNDVPSSRSGWVEDNGLRGLEGVC
jgi:hypothetical protein